MYIRAAKFEDAWALAQIQVDSYQTAYAGILPQSYLDRFTYAEETADWQQLLSSEHHEILYVAETDAGEVVGYALAREGSPDHSVDDCELVALHVRNEYQRRGVGRRLVAAIVAQLHNIGCNSLMLWVLADNPSRGFYERLGGIPLGEKSIAVDETEFRAVELAYGWPDIRALSG